MARNSYSVGVVLIGLAVVLLLGKLGVFHFVGSMLWPLFILVPGLLFHALFFGRIWPAGVLVPGGILTTYALMFLFCNFVGWGAMSYLWPGFILGVAVGLYEFHLFDRNAERGVLIAAMILAAVAVGLFGMTLLFKLGVYVIVLLLILAGVFMILRKPKIW
ncbi:hypothetical protein B5M42_022295 [Paenibacillus athensensis]|uniref:DUF5668 domain-containing protein n=1 Tax=Paenibacillus athensensis TaxID=1967502 RepID=A0A4Y8PQX0_9BACL|nr:hypothetical protein [Paenibacillus athensensis]MCD1261537.1 hypothetical protein [Paenibacillus athensensis]